MKFLRSQKPVSIKLPECAPLCAVGTFADHRALRGGLLSIAASECENPSFPDRILVTCDMNALARKNLVRGDLRYDCRSAVCNFFITRWNQPSPFQLTSPGREPDLAHSTRLPHGTQPSNIL